MPTIIGIALWALVPGFIARKKGRRFWVYYLLSLVITPFITIIIALCVKDLSGENECGNAYQTPDGKAITEDITNRVIVHETKQIDERRISDGQARYCSKCGYELITGSEFCSNCGNKV